MIMMGVMWTESAHAREFHGDHVPCTQKNN